MPKQDLTKKPVGRPKGSKGSYVRKSVKQMNEDILRIQAGDAAQNTFHCCSCGKDSDNAGLFPKSNHFLHANNHMRMPYCNDCCNALFNVTKIAFPDYHDTYRRICQILDIYYNDYLAEQAFQDSNDGNRVTKYITLLNNRAALADKTYSDNVLEDIEKSATEIYKMAPDVEVYDVSQETRDFWGFGLDDKGYHFLDTKYKEWSQDVECEEITQKTIIKNICLIQLQMQKALEEGNDISKLVNQFNASLSSANLQPKQKSDNEMLTDNQCFGLKIKEWEDEEPIDEPDERFRDVDGIKKYIIVWFLGCFCKMFGIKNKYTEAFEAEYNSEISKYTVEPPSYEDDDELGYDIENIFGGDES